MKNTLLFTYSTNILVRLLTVNMKTQKMRDPMPVTLLKMRDLIIVKPAVKMRPHQAAHPH